MTTHFMIDLETMGTSPTAAIVSIGAVKFDPHSDKLPLTSHPALQSTRFYSEVDLASSMRAGLTVDASTILWWLQQSDEARKAITVNAPGDHHFELSAVLNRFKGWVQCHGDGSNDRRLWAHGPSFDVVVLENAARATRITLPFRYNDARDTRTIYELAGVDLKTFPRVGTYHNALDDALTQAAAVQESHRRLARVGELVTGYHAGTDGRYDVMVEATRPPQPPHNYG